MLVSVSDGQHSSTQAIAVSVTPVDDNAPVIVSNGGGATAQIAVDASATAVTRVIATDADLPAPTLVYSIAGGADAARFTIDAQSGVLTFVAAPTGNSSFGVIVRASNGVQTTLQQLSIAVGPAKTNASPSVTIETAPPATTTAPAAPAAHEDPAAIAPAAKPTRSAPTTPDLTSTGGLGSFDAAGRDPLIGASGSFTPTVAMRIANALSIAVPSSTTLRNAAAELNSVVMTAQAAPVIGSAPSSGSRLEPESLAHALDEPANDSTTVLNSSVAVGLALSLGVVGWAARGVTLMASVLVSSPAWSGYDLLPVLRRRDEDADWGDDDNKEHDDSALPANDPKRSGRRDRSTPELIQ